MEKNEMYLGIDVGSVSTNIVLMDVQDNHRILEKLYIRTNGQPIDAVNRGLAVLYEKGYSDDSIAGVGVTGSARTLIGYIVGADIVKNEIIAHAIAAICEIPTVRTVLEIGGQDSKIILVRDQVITDFAMNTVCAAGTGSFLDQQAFRLGIPIEQFGDYALRADSPVRVAGRCTVFAESDMIHKQQLGYTKENIIAGLCEALVRNYLNNVAKGKHIEPPVVFQGGVSFNKGIIAAFEQQLGLELVIPENFSVMGAIGAGILAKEKIHESGSVTKFRGFAASTVKPQIKVHYCSDCSNQCEITRAAQNDEMFAVWGDRCGKHQA